MLRQDMPPLQLARREENTILRRLAGLLCVVALLAGGHDVAASSKRGGPRAGSHSAKAAKPRAAKAPKVRTPKAEKAPKQPSVKAASGVARDERGRIQRRAAARHSFARATGYPNGRPGYVIDHIVPLACGGADTPSNMQWQTIAAGKAKDRTERVGCR
jgi:hypothetical protein